MGTVTEGLAEALARLARDLQREQGAPATLERVVASAIALVPGAEEGSISLVTGRSQVTSVAASDELPRAVDALQSETGQGPCLDAIYEQETVSVPDMASEARWPDFARRAAQAGTGSMLSFQLFVQEDTLGAMNLYARAPHAFDAESEHVGFLFAAHAAIAFSAVRRGENLQVALDSRNLIGQAQGILMERHGVSADEAFVLLTTASQHRNVKLRVVAEDLVGGRRLSR
ncbi:ANTAR domain-containing protein [Kineococcus sp. R8]|uniref:GAF and ANTAR domain-containing protein n=1 Tax=Kineococcus siccus TaxID=2696567 RepID=UPI0014135B3A|nr:GAF and ANTAR domain-containing protein [Kineococcus siccus]NAZ81240.1 ANTAR domain-containing protein [Kineococcus siccus]